MLAKGKLLIPSTCAQKQTLSIKVLKFTLAGGVSSIQSANNLSSLKNDEMKKIQMHLGKVCYSLGEPEPIGKGLQVTSTATGDRQGNSKITAICLKNLPVEEAFFL